LPPLPIYYPPIFVYSSASNSHPQIALKDGTIYTVSDYWLVSGQLHFRALEEGGAKSVEQVIDYDEVDVQKTAELDALGGFRFVLRDESVDQYLRDPPDAEPPSALLPKSAAPLPGSPSR
jgi:hypothetical protein